MGRNARFAALVWRGDDEADRVVVTLADRETTIEPWSAWPLTSDEKQPFLYNLKADHALYRVCATAWRSR